MRPGARRPRTAAARASLSRAALPALLLGLALLPLLALGCGDGDEPAPEPPAVSGSEAPVTGEEGPAGAAGTTGRAPEPVDPLPLPERVEGLNWTSYTAGGYGTAAARRDLERLRDLHSTAVTIVPTWYMLGGSSDVIAPDPGKSPSDASILEALAWVRELGMVPVLKPHVDVLDGTFRGDIQPADRDAWFASYQRFLTHYARMADRQGVALFSVGTELKTLSSETGKWQNLISAVRSSYGGALTYAANWDEAEQVQFWGDLDLIGVDAYYPLSEEGEEDPGLGRLIAAWEPIAQRLQALGERWGRPVLFTELGYPSQRGATVHPFEVVPGEPPDDALQKRAYEAAFQAFFDRPWFRGISWWSWRADPGSGEDLSIDYTPEGKPAEKVLEASQSG